MTVLRVQFVGDAEPQRETLDDWTPTKLRSYHRRLKREVMTDQIQPYIRERLLFFESNTPAPKWSSYLLENFVDKVLGSGGDVSNIYRELYALFDQPTLTDTQANFIKSLCCCGMARSRLFYEDLDFQWMQDAIQSGCKPPQAYLAVWSLPVRFHNEQCKINILQSLQCSEYLSIAIANFEDD